VALKMCGRRRKAAHMFFPSKQCSGRIIPIDLRTKGAVYTFALNYLCSVSGSIEQLRES
jgi:hypothetical protein